MSSDIDVNEFSNIRIGLATPDAIRTWSNGEVKKPETINYRTLKAEKDGLFCEKIFGPMRDWECACGKYRRVRFKGIICERCGVEVTRFKVRRERMGHIELAAPAVHIWYLRGTRSWLAYLLSGLEPSQELKAKALERVIYFAANLVTWVDEERRAQDLDGIKSEMNDEIEVVHEEFNEAKDKVNQRREKDIAQIQKQLETALDELGEDDGAGIKRVTRSADAETQKANTDADAEIAEIEQEETDAVELLERVLEDFCDLRQRSIIDDEEVWGELQFRYGDYFRGGMGAEAIADLMDELDFNAEEAALRRALDPRAYVAAIDAKKIEADHEKLKSAASDRRKVITEKLSAERKTEQKRAVDRVIRGIRDEGKELKTLGIGSFTDADDPASEKRVLTEDAKKLMTALRRRNSGTTTASLAELVDRAIADLDESIKKGRDDHHETIREIAAHAAGAKKPSARPKNSDQPQLNNTDTRRFIKMLRDAKAEIIKIGETHDAAYKKQRTQQIAASEQAFEMLGDLTVDQPFDSVKDKGSSVWEALHAHFADYVTIEHPRKPLSAQRKQKAVRRLKILAKFNRRDEHNRLVNDPTAMILDVVPVIPPELRPMVQLDGGRFATSDLNDLYRRVINRNNRLKRLFEVEAPEIIVNNEKRMLQEAVDALFDNGRRGRAVTGPGGRPLKSLSDMLKGKQGRFRQNLLGKRVDYSGRSVIVAGPTLRLHQCGIPKLMALELFKPFVMKHLVDQGHSTNIKSAKRMVERRHPEVWNVLEDAIREHPVLLNRAPTLHRLGIQAFEPVLVEGKAIQIHPLVCAAFNADFDGDQMAVHLPLSSEAQAEARVLMLSANNVMSPADGRPMTVPSQDMIIGSYYLTDMREPAESNGRRVFRHLHQIEMALESGRVGLHEPIEWRRSDLVTTSANGQAATYEPTTAGRALFNAALPEGFAYVNLQLKKGDVGTLVRDLSDNYSTAEVASSLDAIKDVCYAYASRSGLTISVDDVRTPPAKADILERHEKEAERVENQFRRGIITDGERRQKEVEIWTDATDEVRSSLEDALAEAENNPIDMMVESGARGNMMQVRQIAAIRGLVANPRGDIIPRPIKSSYREGLATLEYFISTPGARKGLVDTALRTADSGYLTRRLVDVAQELIVNEFDPFERAQVGGLWIEDVAPDQPHLRTHLETRLLSRCLAADVTLADGTVLEAGSLVGHDEMETLRDDPSVDRVQVLSPLTDDSPFGVSAKGYGGSLSTGELIEVGEAVGVIAAQSIGEPGTQLTMRTFHTGGVAGTDIASGLPRVVELFEARTPKGKAVLVRRSGVVHLGSDDGRNREILIETDDDTDTYSVASVRKLAVEPGAEVRAGDPLVEGPRDPKELMEILGVRATQQYLVEEVQKVYREQGVSIHDKHIELIVRQMTRRVKVTNQGDTEFLPDDTVDQLIYRAANREILRTGGTPAKADPIIMGITKASLATDSWLSAASFQETTRVLTEAAIESRQDDLRGLKENIVIGKLIPAGTGQGRYRYLDVLAPDYEPELFWQTEDPTHWDGVEAAAWEPLEGAEQMSA